MKACTSPPPQPHLDYCRDLAILLCSLKLENPVGAARSVFTPCDEGRSPSELPLSSVLLADTMLVFSDASLLVGTRRIFVGPKWESSDPEHFVNH